MTRSAPGFSNTMMLETDGTVLMQGGGVSKNWYRLTPDGNGSYANGTWSQVASMGLERLYYGSNVLPDGRVLVQGGEYTGPTGAANFTNTGEIYDPNTNAWSKIKTFPLGSFGDDPTVLLPDGTILAGYLSGPQTYVYDPAADLWTRVGDKLRNDASDEETWIKLPDDSILSYDIFSSINTGVGHAQRYIPATKTWVDAGIVPISLSNPGVGYELGPGVLLADGRAMYFGANGNTALYTPSTNSWAAGPVMPSGLGADDSPGTILPNGRVLLTADTPLFKSPTHILEFDPSSNTFTDLTTQFGSQVSTSYFNGPAYIDRMLMLPTGQVLINNGGSQLALYTPTQAPLAISTPTITSIVGNGDGSYTLTGTGLNGISEGASYGDDAEMATNYPIIRFTNASAQVFYARTYGWTGQIAQGSLPQTTRFTLPLGLPANPLYAVNLVANGSPSTAFNFGTPTLAGDPAPTIAVAASATPNPDPGKTAALSVLAADTLGESTLTYTWTTTSVPAGVPLPSFAINGTNAAKNDTVTFTRAGSYTFQVTATNLAGLSVASSVTVNVTQTLSAITVSPSLVNVNPGATRQFTATSLDQFGVNMVVQPGITWSLAGGGTLSATGLYTAPPATGALATVTATSGVVSGSASVFVLTPPLVTADIGSPALAGAAGDDGNGLYKLVGAGTDIFGTADQFRFAYRSLTGDGTLIARVVSEQPTNPFAKAGVMFRNDLTAGSAEAFMAITASSGSLLQARLTAGGSTASVGTAGITAPYWVRLVRSGNVFTGSYSADGITWVTQGSASIPMNTTVFVGLALTSHDAATLNTTTFDHVNLSTAPTVAGVAFATPNPDPGKTATLAVLGADLAGESNLTYTWSATSIPAGAPAPTFSTNGNNAAKSSVVTFGKAGVYTLTATITNFAGLSVTSAVNVTVTQTTTTITLAPSTDTVPQGGTRQFAASAFDQFGDLMAVPPTFTWSVVPGGAGGSVSASGLYTAPTNTFGTDQVRATSGAVTGTASVTVTQVQATVGPVSVAWGSAGTATLGTDPDGLRLLPAGRSLTLPWLNLNQMTITLSKAGTLVPADVSVTGVNFGSYGPVTITGSGTSYVITWAQPIAAADRVTITIGNATIATFTRRLDVLPGDVNDDGVVTSADVGAALAAVNGVFFFADLDGDGQVTSSDAKAIRKFNGTRLP